VGLVGSKPGTQWREAMAAEALKKWDGEHLSRGGVWEGAYPSAVLWVRGYCFQEMFENIGANLCNFVHFGNIRSSKVGRKIDAFSSHF